MADIDENAVALARAVLKKCMSGPSFGIDYECGICGGDSRSTIPHYRDCPVPAARRTLRKYLEQRKGEPFQAGGEIGDPKDGYRIRCRNTPKVIATENEPGKDGLIGSMSLCDNCLKVFRKQMPKDFATITTIYSGSFSDIK